MKEFITFTVSDNVLVAGMFENGQFRKGYWAIMNTNVSEQLDEESFLGILKNKLVDIANRVSHGIKSLVGTVSSVYVTTPDGTLMSVDWENRKTEFSDDHLYKISEYVRREMINRDPSSWLRDRDIDLKIILPPTYYVRVYIPLSIGFGTEAIVTLVKDVYNTYISWSPLDKVIDLSDENRSTSEIEDVETNGRTQNPSQGGDSDEWKY